MRNIKQLIPVLIFVVTLVLSGVSILTSQELAKRKYIPPSPLLAAMIPAGNCLPNKGFGNDPDRPTTPSGGSDCAGIPSYYTYGCVDAPGDPGNTTCGYWPPQDNPDPSIIMTPLPPPPPTNTPTNKPTPTPTKSPTPTATLTPTKTPTLTLTPTASPSITPTPSISPSVTKTPTPTTTPGPSAFRHKICQNNACVEVDCSPSNQPCTSTCSSDVSCQPPPVVPTTPKAGNIIPTVMTIVGGAGLLILGLVLAL